MGVIGIDLGTTNTVAAVDGSVVHLPEQGGPLMPSVVAFMPNGDAPVGRAARHRRAIDPKNTIFSAKRIIGQRWHSMATKEFKRRYPFELQENDGGAEFVTRAGSFSPVQIGTRVLEAVASEGAVDFAEMTAVITVPALFKDAQRDATIAAGKAAGLEKVFVIDEPSATAAACLTHSGEKIKKAVVYDLGGGTFDVAVVQCDTDPFTVLGHAGDLYLGGDDIDHGLADWVAQQVLEQHRWDVKSDSATFARLVVAAEQAKIRLSTEETADIPLSEVDPVGPVSGETITVDRKNLAELASKLVRRTFILCDEVLMQVGIKTRDLDAVFLAGGATYLPMIQEGVAAYFGKEVGHVYNPMEVVAIGAAMLGSHDDAQSKLRS